MCMCVCDENEEERTRYIVGIQTSTGRGWYRRGATDPTRPRPTTTFTCLCDHGACTIYNRPYVVLSSTEHNPKNFARMYRICILAVLPLDPRHGTSPGGKEGRRKAHKKIMTYRPDLYLWEITVNNLFTAVPTAGQRSPGQGPSGRSPVVGTWPSVFDLSR